MCIVRAALQGNRNFPILQASIQTGQPDPFKTTYTVNLQVTKGGQVQPVTPWPLFQRYLLNVTTYDALNTVQLSQNAYAYSVTPYTNIQVAASIQGIINLLGAQLGDPLMPLIQVGVVGDRLTFSTIAAVLPVNVDGWWYSVQAYREQDIAPFGFASMSPLESETTGTRTVTLPYPCSYELPLVTSTVFTGSATLQWEPQVSGIFRPREPLTEVDTESEAYWLYDYSWFARLLNKTLASAFNDLVATAASQGIILSLACPTVSYVPSRSAFSMRVSYGSTPTTAEGGDQITVTLNKPLANLMLWPGTYLRDGTETLVFDSAVGTADRRFLDLLPDFPATGSAWSPVGSLVFSCSRWMIRSEVMSAPNRVGASTPTNNNPSYSTQFILSDVVPAFSDASDWNCYPVLYSPQVLRWIEMPAGSSPLRDLDFTCAWRNAITGSIRNVTLNPGASFSVKILLQRKDICG